MATPFSSEFWDDEEDYMWEALSALYLSILFAGMNSGVTALPPELQTLVDFDVLNTNALRLAKEYRYELIKGITDTTRKQVQDAMSDWIRSGDPLKVLEDALTPIFGEVRANMISATEVTRIYAKANASAFESTGFVNMVKWMTNQDDRVCPICAPLDGQHFDPADINALPPAHVNCRCWIQPVVDVDAVKREAERILNG